VVGPYQQTAVLMHQQDIAAYILIGKITALATWQVPCLWLFAWVGLGGQFPWQRLEQGRRHRWTKWCQPCEAASTARNLPAEDHLQHTHVLLTIHTTCVPKQICAGLGM